MGPAGPAHILPVGLCVCTLYLCTLARHCSLVAPPTRSTPAFRLRLPSQLCLAHSAEAYFGPAPFGLRILFRYPHSNNSLNGNRSLIGLLLDRITD